jgi:hypothetical protein
VINLAAACGAGTARPVARHSPEDIMAPRPPPPPEPPQPPGQKFRTAIEKAKLEGLDPDALTLRLTLGDVSRLKRDRAIAADDISFTDGEMRYLGIKVVAGDIETSALVILQA